MKKVKHIQSVATIGSFACLIHCLITPFILVFAPSLGSLFTNHTIEIGLLIGAIICGTFVVVKGYCTHKKIHCILLFALGALTWLSHIILHDILHFSSELPFIISGSVFVATSYYINHVHTKCNKTCFE